MISPILAGSITAFAYAVSTLGAARSSRLAGAIPAVAGVMLVGSLLLLPVALLVTPPNALQSVKVTATLPGCSGLRVTPVVAGTAGM